MANPVTHDRRHFEWRLSELYKLFLYIGILFFAATQLPNQLWDATTYNVFMLLGILGVWRYSWWFTHFVRANIYARFVFPRRREQADKLWQSGWRPRHIFYMMTTYKEDRETTEKVMYGIIRDCREIGVPTTLFLGSGDIFDERLIQDYVRRFAQDIPLEVIAVRQTGTGKRNAIGLTLRAISRYGVGKDDPVIFMDGDSIIAPGCLSKCLPFFHLYKQMHALTTDEKAILFGPKWMQYILDLRFAQRHMAMQSHALSNKVLTLTGRLSILRAEYIVQHEFIRTIEADHLTHWLWGDFRFLSGDDKSSWYYLLRAKANMFYIPDAMVYTVEYVKGKGIKRMWDNLQRWSGNMLRNGIRATALGPKRVGFFIWWCIVDQRIAMWTMLVSPIAVLAATVLKGPIVLVAYFVWIAFSRLMLSMFLYPYAGKIYISFPFLMYANQLMNSIVKVYIIFRLPKQKWANRGYEASGLAHTRKKLAMAAYLTTLYLMILIFFVMLYVELIEPSSWLTIRFLWFSF
jgi:glycosyltransferase Alg8